MRLALRVSTFQLTVQTGLLEERGKPGPTVKVCLIQAQGRRTFLSFVLLKVLLNPTEYEKFSELSKTLLEPVRSSQEEICSRSFCLGRAYWKRC